MAPEAIAPMSQEECEAHMDAHVDDSERLKMRLGRASDIWSLGCILYQIVFGRPPFAGIYQKTL
jgi:serine/threonine-protein kinase TTK/MPS1